jgi:hypothetical protein
MPASIEASAVSSRPQHEQVPVRWPYLIASPFGSRAMAASAGAGRPV